MQHSVLPDVQKSIDVRNIAIDRVGIKDVTVPMLVATEDGVQPTVATIEMCVALPANQKGTHMSRFVALLSEEAKPLSAASVRDLLARMLVLLDSDGGFITIRCPFFVKKIAPVSKLESIMNYEVEFIAEHRNGTSRVLQKIEAPVTSLCPCSKEISQFGAHNQRSRITIAAEIDGDMPLEELIRVAETSASCELWSRLKRSDEKYVTEYAYEHPKFVEDIIRDVGSKLNADSRVLYYCIEAENFESIHNHSAYALIERDKRVA